MEGYNPITKRRIKIDGPKYKELLSLGYSREELSYSSSKKGGKEEVSPKKRGKEEVSPKKGGKEEVSPKKDSGSPTKSSAPSVASIIPMMKSITISSPEERKSYIFPPGPYGLEWREESTEPEVVFTDQSKDYLMGAFYAAMALTDGNIPQFYAYGKDGEIDLEDLNDDPYLIEGPWSLVVFTDMVLAKYEALVGGHFRVQFDTLDFIRGAEDMAKWMGEPNKEIVTEFRELKDE